jgi:hypothetical protein
VLGLSPAVAKSSPPTETVLHSFCSQQGCPDSGSNGLIQGSDGNFYGVGGSTMFQLTPSGTFTTIQLVCTQGAGCPIDLDGGALTEGSDGNFYGVADRGNVPPSEVGSAGTCS